MPKCSKKLWTEEEDERLREAVRIHNAKRWKEISKYVGTKDSYSCYQHYFRVLNPTISRAKWSEADYYRLVYLIRTFGKSAWATISKYMMCRTDIMCRTKFLEIQRAGNTFTKHLKELLDGVSMEELEAFLEANGYDFHLQIKNAIQEERQAQSEAYHDDTVKAGMSSSVRTRAQAQGVRAYGAPLPLEDGSSSSSEGPKHRPRTRQQLRAMSNDGVGTSRIASNETAASGCGAQPVLACMMPGGFDMPNVPSFPLPFAFMFPRLLANGRGMPYAAKGYPATAYAAGLTPSDMTALHVQQLQQQQQQQPQQQQPLQQQQPHEPQQQQHIVQNANQQRRPPLAPPSGGIPFMSEGAQYGSKTFGGSDMMYSKRPSFASSSPMANAYFQPRLSMDARAFSRKSLDDGVPFVPALDDLRRISFSAAPPPSPTLGIVDMNNNSLRRPSMQNFAPQLSMSPISGSHVTDIMGDMSRRQSYCLFGNLDGLYDRDEFAFRRLSFADTRAKTDAVESTSSAFDSDRKPFLL